MNRVLRLLIINCFLNYCNNAARAEYETGENADFVSEISETHENSDFVPDINETDENADFVPEINESNENGDFVPEINNVKNNGRDDNDVTNEYTNLMARDYFAIDDKAQYDNHDSPEYDQSRPLFEPLNNIVILDNMDTRNYKAEMKVGNKADVLGTNPHYYQPDVYPDFSRRFVLQYPYKEVEKKNNHKKKRKETKKLIPKLATPEFVLAVAQKSALLDAARPKNPTEKLITKDILRTGNYWNSFWKEDVNPLALRSNKANKLESIRAEIPPGSTLYDVVSKMKDISPTLLYVINDKKA